MEESKGIRKLDKQPLVLSKEFKDLLHQLENTRDHFFITGKAGTGKSTLLQLFRKTSKKRIAVVAPTGIAALNVKGQTIHSFFRFPPKMVHPGDLTKRKNHRLYKKMDTLIIDEISMVRADIFDNIDIFLQKNREDSRPFGGVQLILFGDLFQLPPVISSNFERQYFRTHYPSPYFFSAQVFSRGLEMPMIELREVYRQKDRYFIRLLDSIRTNTMDMDDLDAINERFGNMPESDIPHIQLCSINATANRINTDALAALDTPLYEYKAEISGNFKPSVFPTDQFLHLKEGAQVMFVKNDIEKRFVNGTLGFVVAATNQSVKVEVQKENGDKEIIDVEQQEWEIIKYAVDKENPNRFTTEVTGSFVQYPLKLAWAITIHKSQGKTFDTVVLDLGRGAFEFGQTYVALSRCRTLEGIFLKKKITPKDIITDQRIVEYYDSQRYYW